MCHNSESEVCVHACVCVFMSLVTLEAQGQDFPLLGELRRDPEAGASC